MPVQPVTVSRWVSIATQDPAPSILSIPCETAYDKRGRDRVGPPLHLGCCGALQIVYSASLAMGVGILAFDDIT